MVISHGPRHPDATGLTRDNSPRESWRQGHPDARDILTLGTSWRSGHPDAKSSKLLRSAFLFSFPCYATATLSTINVRLLWRKYDIFR